MKNITRKTFIKNSLLLSTYAGISPLMAKALSLSQNNPRLESDFYKRIVEANNKEVTQLIQTFSVDIVELKRRLGYDFANIAAAYCEKETAFYQNETLVPCLLKIIHFLLKEQKADGTLDIGNLASPPDTAFILEPLCMAYTILNNHKSSALKEVKSLLKDFILKAGEAMRTGGIHTPNHRWVICAALARINALFPDLAYVKRIDEWFSEGLFIDSEGHYLERSMIYSEVIDRCLITIARLLGRTNLLEPVRKNLNMVYFYIEPNGDMVATDSRRQDQFAPKTVLDFYHDYLYLAIRDNNAEFAAIAQFIETVKGFEESVLNDLLPYFMEEPLYKKPLPTPKNPPTEYEKFFKETNLVRIRHNQTTTTIFGGTDWPLIIGSGRSTSPNFFAFRKGEAILKYMRFSTDFFSTGYFRSHGVKYTEGGYVLNQKLESPYYQPLPDNLKRADGDYKHSQSTDGRFWNKMDFENRPQSNIRTLETTISVTEKNGANELIFKSLGTEGVHVTIEFCFNAGGNLTGVKKGDDADNYFLESGTGSYTMGNDTIQFGQGLFKHARLKAIDGEMYTSHFGSLRTTGMHVFITGITPFEHKLVIK